MKKPHDENLKDFFVNYLVKNIISDIDNVRRYNPILFFSYLVNS